MLSKEEFLSYVPNQEQIAAGETVFMCMAAVQLIGPIVRDYQQRILNELGWPGLNPKTAYQLPDTVWPEYHRRCNDARVAANLHVDDPEKCPLLVAERLLSEAQEVLIGAMESVTGISYDQIMRSANCLVHLKSLVDLNLRMLAPWCKNRMKERADAEV